MPACGDGGRMKRDKLGAAEQSTKGTFTINNVNVPFALAHHNAASGVWESGVSVLNQAAAHGVMWVGPRALLASTVTAAPASALARSSRSATDCGVSMYLSMRTAFSMRTAPRVFAAFMWRR